jgi:hypothetical protein
MPSATQKTQQSEHGGRRDYGSSLKQCNEVKRGEHTYKEVWAYSTHEDARKCSGPLFTAYEKQVEQKLLFGVKRRTLDVFKVEGDYSEWGVCRYQHTAICDRKFRVGFSLSYSRRFCKRSRRFGQYAGPFQAIEI